jgi:soluble lytic murein transglycosylase-like protein
MKLISMAFAALVATSSMAVAAPRTAYMSFNAGGGSSQDMIVSRAAQYGIPHAVIAHVARKESTFRCSPGNPRYHGPLQISYQSAKALGYHGSASGLNNCGAGLEYGLRHLALCARAVGNNPAAAAKCHETPGRYGVRVSWN